MSIFIHQQQISCKTCFSIHQSTNQYEVTSKRNSREQRIIYVIEIDTILYRRIESFTSYFQIITNQSIEPAQAIYQLKWRVIIT